MKTTVTSLILVLFASSCAPHEDVEAQTTSGLVQLEGELSVVIADPEEGPAWVEHSLRDGAGRLTRLDIVEPPDWLETGAKLRVTGERRDGALIVDAARGGQLELLEPAYSTRALSQGPRKVAVVMFRFAGDGQPYSAAQARTALFGNVAAFVKEASFGLSSLTSHVDPAGDVFGWFDIDANLAGNCNYNDWIYAAQRAATQAGVNLGQYQHVVYGSSRAPGCWWAGLGWLNGNVVIMAGGQLLNYKYLAHELGHNFGFHHANVLHCRENGKVTTVAGSCTTQEYADPFDTMGNHGYRHFSAAHKARAGWIPPARVVDGTKGGEWTIAPIETASTLPQAITISRGIYGFQSHYWLDFRTTYGWDNYPAESPVVQGVSIRLSNDGSRYAPTYLLDASPDQNFGDPTLRAGASFDDPKIGVRVRVLSVAPTGARVRVEKLGTTPPPAPASAVWVDDALPAGARASGLNGDGWTWVSANPAPQSGQKAHQSNVAAGLHQHYFEGASQALAVAAGDKLYAYVYLDPANPPSEVMLQWNDGTWDHRAYWGSDLIPWGTNGTASRRYMGALPAKGAWIKLEVPAASVGLEGRTVHGMAFTLYDGRATWDQAGKAR